MRNKSTILAIMSSSLLAAVLIYHSLYSTTNAFSLPLRRGPITCSEYAADPTKQTCCQNEFGTGPKGVPITLHWCTDCTNTRPPSNCGPRYPARDVSNLNVVPGKLPSDVVQSREPQTTSTCPDGSAQDANGNCISNTNQNNARLSSQSSIPDNNQGQLASNDNNNNIPSADNNLKSKGKNLVGQTEVGGGGSELGNTHPSKTKPPLDPNASTGVG